MFIGSKTGYSRLLIAIGIWLSLEANPAKGTDDWQAPYQLGSGYALSDSGFRLGGYTNAEVTAAGEKPWQFQVTDLSLFVSWDKNSWLRFFSELELADVLTAGQHQTLSTSQTHFEYERFYFDGLVNDKLTVRVGKFLTPIGQWNVLHAAPLVWTTYRPVATDDLFSTHVSGVMLHGIFPFADRQLEYAVYGDATEAADPLSSDNPFKNALGTHLRYQWNDQLQIGVSFTNFLLQNIPSARYSLFGVDGLWQYKKYEIRSEIVYRSHGNQINERSLWQGYLQGVLPLTQHFFWVGRYEAFQQMFDKTGYAGVMGLAYRPSPPVVWKLEYRMGANNDKLAPDGLAASFAVLF